MASFYYPVTIHRNSTVGDIDAPVVNRLPILSSSANGVVIVVNEDARTSEGLYVWDGFRWRFVLPQVEVSKAVIQGDLISIYYDQSFNTTLPGQVRVFRNGVFAGGSTITKGKAAYAVRTTVNSSGYVLPPASQSTLGGVKVPSSSALTVDSAGNIDLSEATLDQIHAAITGIAYVSGGMSLVEDSGTHGMAVIKSLVQGTNITLTDDNGLIRIDSTPTLDEGTF